MLFSSKASILLNGFPKSDVRYQRGLSEGGPLSPLLFMLVTNVSSSMFSHELRSKVLVGVPLGRFRSRCNLHNEDDMLVLTTGGLEDLKIVEHILYLFEGMTGLETNFLNTYLYLTPGFNSRGNFKLRVGLAPIYFPWYPDFL